MNVKGLFIGFILVCASVTLVKRDTGLRLHPSIQPSPQTSHAARLNVQEVYGRLPLSFELNRRPANRQKYFVARGRGYNLFLVGSDAIVAVGDGRPNNTHVVQMRVLGANSQPHASGISPQRGRSNYLIGSDPRQWRIGVPTFDGVLLHDVYRGIDLTYYGKQGDLEYDFVVAPGSDPSVIRFAIDGTERLRFDGHDLLLKVGAGEFRLHAPVVYQMCDGKRVPVSSSFSLTGRNEVGFDIGSYDARRALVIDPGLAYSTYLGGSGQDQVLGISVGQDGSAYVTGSTSSMDYPVSAAGLQKVLGRSDSTVFVTKLNPTGTAIEYSTYLGGSSSNLGGAIAVAGNGEAYVTGSTYSSDFPVTPTALQRHNSGGMDAFIATLSSDGSHLLYSTYLGGSGDDEAHGLALDKAGNT